MVCILSQRKTQRWWLNTDHTEQSVLYVYYFVLYYVCNGVYGQTSISIKLNTSGDKIIYDMVGSVLLHTLRKQNQILS